MSRADEIAQGLRDESGALIGGLHVLDYVQGMTDFQEGAPPPQMSSPSYDLGRVRASEKQEMSARADEWIKRSQREASERVRELLKDRPDILARYDADMAAIDARAAGK